MIVGAGTFSNQGTMTQTGGNNLFLEGGATLNNAKGAVYNWLDNTTLNESAGGTFINAGTFKKTKGTGIGTVACNTFNNTGTVTVKSGTLNISATVTQVSGSTLTTGKWAVTGTAKVVSTLHITSAGTLTTLGTGTSSKATVTLTGPNATFTNLSGLATINAGRQPYPGRRVL